MNLLSVDEKTGIQALERFIGRAPDSQGGHQRREFEYRRHGVSCLIAGYEVATGEVIATHLGPTRTEVDFLNFIQSVESKYPAEEEIVFLADQLNTHKSAKLVEWVAQKIGYTGELGYKGKLGILKSMSSRMAFLEEESHRIRFLFTPKHCSWLNPIENWFGQLVRHCTRNGNFTSIEDLEAKILSFIEYFNTALKKPLNWKFSGFKKAEPIQNK